MERGLHKSSVRKNKSFTAWLAKSNHEISNLLRYDKELEVFLIIARFDNLDDSDNGPYGVTKHRLEREAKVNGKRLNQILSSLKGYGLVREVRAGHKHYLYLTEKGKLVLQLIGIFEKLWGEIV
ncbi:hypothetical protein [Metallosphaera sp.]|jgi:predicted transcriptional regulator|uniref:hypothetical protein n=1 Tax=Metallosphaera sp. TaxID=2020860 RepID=UPI00316FF31E